MLTRRRILIVAALGALLPGAALAATANSTVIAGWEPMVSLFGGDARSTVRTLSRVTDAYSVYLGHTEIDWTTQEFMDEATDHLKDFDLDGLRKILPERRGDGRALYVQGELAGRTYRVRRAKRNSGFRVGLKGPRNDLADMSATLYAAEYERDDEDRYLLGASFGLGLGPLTWGGVMRAERDLARLATLGTPDPARMQPVEPSTGALAHIRKFNPGLGAEDQRVLGVLYDAFPALGDMLINVGVIEDVQKGPTRDGVHPIRLRMRADVERLGKDYEHFADYVDNLDDVMVADVKLLDDAGRTLTEIHIDSEKLLLEVRAYIKDGLPVPFSGSTVHADDPLDPLSSALSQPRVRIDARLNFLGIICELDNLRLKASYEASDGYTDIQGRIANVPGIKMDGRAFGLFAPRFLDVFIPGDIEGQTRHFFEVLARGNGGKGGNAHIVIGAKQPGENGVLSVEAETEAIDSFIVRVGAGVVADRVLPGKRAEEDANRLAADLHTAFKKDFDRFRRTHGG